MTERVGSLFAFSFCCDRFNDNFFLTIWHKSVIPNWTLSLKYNFTFIYNLFIFTEGTFQSDALLVPEGCLFDHIHNASRCWPFVRWNQTGAAACQDRGMQMRSFAMLLPCGISLFSGVEFVCCPKHFKGEFHFLLQFFFSFFFPHRGNNKTIKMSHKFFGLIKKSDKQI